MNLSDLNVMLLSIAPALASIASIISGVCVILRSNKHKDKKKDEEIAKERAKVVEMAKNISVIKSKLASIESELSKED